ncbi:MAG: hypothetical protein LJE88_12690 [Deltaproteobacteria bacterium]|nr:hypothetical protein [Deltaproteobacteria bacterium]
MVRYTRTIPPGGVGQVTLQVNTNGLQGRLTKSARMTTNDPRESSTKLYLSINVRAHILVEPGPKILLQGIVGDDIQKVVHIHSAENEPFEITRINTNLRSVIDYKLSRKDDGREYDLQVISRASDQKSASGFLTLYTNHPKKQVVKLSVYLRVKPEVQVWPNRVDFYEGSKSGSKKKESKRILMIMNNRGKSFKIKELNYNKDYFQVRSLAKNDSPASRYQFEVVPLVDSLPPGRLELQDTLTIRTDSSAKAGEIEVPLSIRIKQ